MESHANLGRPAFGLGIIFVGLFGLGFIGVMLLLIISESESPPSQEQEVPSEEILGVRYSKEINAAARKYPNVPVALIAAVCKAESDFNPNVTSSANAQGIMQLMPFNSDGIDPFDPEQNILRGTKILSGHLKKYNNDIQLAAAAYNAGAGAVDRYNGVPPYQETQQYVKKVSEFYESYKQTVKSNEIVASTGKLENPVPQAEVSSEFGMRRGTLHTGRDFAAPLGTPILSADNGKVIRVATPTNNPKLGPNKSYGTYIDIDHGGGIKTRYAHMYPNEIEVRPGQKVKQGERIARVGNMGNSSGPHLHFEVLKNGKPVDPKGYLK